MQGRAHTGLRKEEVNIDAVFFHWLRFAAGIVSILFNPELALFRKISRMQSIPKLALLGKNPIRCSTQAQPPTQIGSVPQNQHQLSGPTPKLALLGKKPKDNSLAWTEPHPKLVLFCKTNISHRSPPPKLALLGKTTLPSPKFVLFRKTRKNPDTIVLCAHKP